MKMVKSLILGSAAGLLAMGGAQAADLPVKAKAVEYVRICSLYGAGFWYIPGTDTCIKLGGYLRVDLNVNSNSDSTGNTNGVAGLHNRFSNAYTWRSREDLNIDTRTATEYGVVRTFFDATFSWTSGTFNPVANTGTIYENLGSANFSAPNNANAGAVANGTVGVYYAFIQFAGFTIGKAISTFSAPWTNYPGNNFDGLVGGGGTVTGVNQFTYTAQFGNGVSGSISAQDPTAYYQAGIVNTTGASAATFINGALGASAFGGTSYPDIVGVLKVDQAWGVFQASVAAHNNHASYYFGAYQNTVLPALGEFAGHPDDKWGWAGQLALSVLLPFIAKGDVLNVQGVYTNGASRYNIQDLAGPGVWGNFGNSGLAGVYQSIGVGATTDSLFSGVSSGPGSTQQQLTETWGFRGGYTHNWDPYWNTSIYGAYAAVRYNAVAKDLICGPGGVLSRLSVAQLAGVTACNPDFNIAQAGIITRWTPVKNLTFSADLTWNHLDQKNAGVLTAVTPTVSKPTANYEFKDQDTLSLLLRAQRNW
jgi:porin-like protein